MPVHANVIPINFKSAFNPSPLLPRRMQRVFEAQLFDEASELMKADTPLGLLSRICLAYRPACRSDSTAALGWARLLARDLGWRLYEGTYEYILYDNHFVKLVDKGISVQAILLAWARDVSSIIGSDWLWFSRDELQTLAGVKGLLMPTCRLQRAWTDRQQLMMVDERPRVVTVSDDSQILDGLEDLRNLVVSTQLRRIAPRVDEHMRQR